MTDFQSFVPVCRYQETLAFSPDGNTIACSSNFSGQYNLWLHPVDAGRPRQLTRFTEHAVRQAAFSPDGSQLVFSADHRGGEVRQLYLVPVAGGEPTAITDADGDHILAPGAFSPDGKCVAYAVNDRESTDQDIVVRDLATADTVRVRAREGLVAEPVAFSPDGRHLLVRAERSTVDTDLYLLDTQQPTANWRCLTGHSGTQLHHAGPFSPDAAFLYGITDRGEEWLALVRHDLAAGTTEICDAPEWDVEGVALSRDGSTLAWAVNEDGRSVVRVRRDGVDLPPQTVPVGQIRCLRAAPDGRRLAFLLDSATRPTELCVIDLDRGGFRYLTDNRPAVAADGLPLVEPELVRYTSHDGRRVPAFVYRPKGDGPFPVVVSVHGGPEEQERPIYRYSGLYQYLLASGIAVVAPNFRGSTGYGTPYQKLIHRDWGGGELGDLEWAARWVLGQEWADPSRLAVFGGSFGGFAALSCLARLPRYWSAGVSVMGPTNLVTFLRAVPPTWRPLMEQWVGDPDKDAAMLAARSPLTYADGITASLFVLQGARDRRVSRSESDQLVASLKARGNDVRYDVYGDEGHGFTKRENEIQAWGDVGYFLVGNLRRSRSRAHTD